MLHIQKFTFSPFSENTYVLYTSTGNAAIIDPGCYGIAEQKELKAFIDKNNLTVQEILLTHCHIDHVFGLKFAVDTWGKIPKTHKTEEIVFGYAAASASKWGVDYNAYTGGFEYLQEGDKITIDDNELNIIEAPGHSPGHICFYISTDGYIVSGDVLFYRSIGRTDLLGSNHAALIDNIKNKLFVLPPATIVYNGHGQETTIGDEKVNNPFLTSGS